MGAARRLGAVFGTIQYRIGCTEENAAMTNLVSAMEVKRRGMAAIEEALQHGPVHIVKRNKTAAVVLSEEDFRRLTGQQSAGVRGLSAMQWLLAQAPAGARSKREIDRSLAAERAW